MFVVEGKGKIGGISVIKGIEGDAALICASRTGQPWSSPRILLVFWRDRCTFSEAKKLLQRVSL
jgi:hypothetical protein